MASYFINSCSGATSGIVDFGSFTINEGGVYALIFVDEVLQSGCYTVVSGTTGTTVDVVREYQLFESCDYCVTGVPVNTIYEYTSECCDPVTGETGESAFVPHPIYPSGLGVAIQMNAVALGGFNGLNN